MRDAGAGHGPRDLIRRLLAPHRPGLALALLACGLYLPSVWNRDLWNPDEPRYAEVSRVMVERGEYVLPHLNGAVYSEKPPFFFWLSILAGGLPGIPSGSGPRLVAAMAALGTLLLTFRLGRTLADPQTGWLAAMVLATSSMFVLHASSGVIDSLLTLLIVASIACGLRARETRSPVLWAVFYALCGFAVITKGPVGIAIPAGVMFLLAIQEDGLGRVWPRQPAHHPAWGLLVILAVAAAWVAPATARGGAEYAETILWKQNIGRAYHSWHHQEPLHYFLKVFPGAYLPWIAILPAALSGAARSARADRASRLALTWFAYTFIFFSLISGKKTRYLLPLLPAASLLVALELRPLLAGAAGRLRSLLPLAVCIIAVGLVGVGLVASGAGGLESFVSGIPGLAPDQAAGLLWFGRLPGSLAVLLPGLVVTCLAGWSLWWLWRDPRAGLAAALAALICLIAWAQLVGVPAADQVKSARPLAEKAAAASGPGGVVALYREGYAGVFNFYLRRERLPVIRGRSRLEAFLVEHPGGVVIAAKQDVAPISSWAVRLKPIECRRVGGDEMCVLAGPP